MTVKRDDDFFWRGVDEGKLLAQRCAACGALQHPPLPRCSTCQSSDLAAQQLSGRGAIITWVVLQHPSKPDPNPRIGIMVKLEEGLRFASNLVDAANVRIGAPVMVEFGDLDGERLPLFRTVALTSSARSAAPRPLARTRRTQ